MKQVLLLILVIFAVVALNAMTFTFNQTQREAKNLEADLQYRSSLLLEGLRESVEPNFINKSDTYLQSLVEKYADRQRIAGLAILDNKGEIIAASSSLPKDFSNSKEIAANVMDADAPDGSLSTVEGKSIYTYAAPLKSNDGVIGSLVVVHNASYIKETLFSIWRENLLRIVTQGLFLSIVIVLILRWFIIKPIQKLAESLQVTKAGHDQDNIFQNTLLQPLSKEIFRIQKNLTRAKITASEEARAGLAKSSAPWTAERLQEFIKQTLKNRRIYLVSNREPYIHSKRGNKIEYYSPASGMVTALEPVMDACGGTWIAFGSGDADRQVVDKTNSILVPPSDPKYTLRRVWLTKKEEEGYYNGFSNEGLWPLCHQAFTRPIFRKEDWEQYVSVNKKFARAVLSEMKDESKPIVFVQDFHLALVPQIIKKERPDATIGIFWHIPWPSPESFSICPWKKEVLDGILGADIVGFHTQLHCNNFIETVRHELESLVDLERFSVTRNNHKSFVKPFPISIEFPMQDLELSSTEKARILKEFDVKTKLVGLGVDRLDYTKGILERFKAIEIFLKKYPLYQGKFTFLQISVPSRTKVKRYQDFRNEVEKEAERINTLYRKNGWRPIVLSLAQYRHEEVFQFYKLADFCLVTSLDDGMNLVAKEFVTARNDNNGVLILSEFTGASRQLTNALLINPYDAENAADVIKDALEMSDQEKSRRMRSMREEIKSNNIYLWSVEIIKALENIS